MRVIAFMNQKGGVAKTTTTVNLASILAHDHDKGVLVIDADSQANASAFLRKEDDTNDLSLSSLLRISQLDRSASTAKFILSGTVRKSACDGVDLLPAYADLMDLDLSAASDQRAWTDCLRLALDKPAGTGWDYVLIDCPPAFNAASAAALIAADEVIIPIRIDAFALEGMAHLMQQVSNMQRINPKLRVSGVLPVMWYKSERNTAAVRMLRDADLPLLPSIRRSDRVDEMTWRRLPLIEFSPTCAAARDYRVLAYRLLKGGVNNGNV